MIKKSLIVFALLFIFYTTFIHMKPKLSISEHQEQNNLIKAENFIYNSNYNENLIVGSSLACRFVMDSLPDFYNLAFGGQSIFDGLKIVKETGNLPKNIYIETNVLLRKESTEFTKPLLSTIYFILKRYFLSMRSDKQPIPIFIEYFKYHKNKIKAYLMPKKSITENKTTEKTKDVDLKKIDLSNKMLTLQIEGYSKKPDSILLENQVLLLFEYVNYLKNNGVNVCFFEMPINYNLTELKKSKIIRNKIYELFPKDEFCYILRDSSKYETSDGVHLGKEEALKYTIYFRNQLTNRY